LISSKYGNFEFGAQVSAVAATAGVSANTDYGNGVAIFTIAKSGLMFETELQTSLREVIFPPIFGHFSI